MSQDYKILSLSAFTDGGITSTESSFVSTSAVTLSFSSVTMDSISASSVTSSNFYGDGSNITGIPYVTGGTYSAGTAVFTNNTGGTFNFTGVSYTRNVIKVGKGGDVNFSSIKSAIDSVTDSSTVNPYTIIVGPGLYVEGTLTMKTGISVVGDGGLGSVLIVPTANTITMVVGADGSSINNLILSSANGVNGLAVYHQGSGGTGFLIKDCNFNDNTTHVHSHGLSASTIVYIDRCSATGNNTTGFKATNVSGNFSQIILTNSTYKDLIVPVTSEFISISGVNSTFTLTNTTIRATLTGGTKGISVYDGGEFRGLSSSLRGFDIGVYVPSGGTSQNVVLDSITISECNDDIIVTHTGSTGYFNGVVDIKKVTLNNDTPFYIYRTDLRELVVSKKGQSYSSIAEAINSITDSSETNRYVVKVGPGIYHEPLIDLSSKPYVSIVGDSILSVIIIPDGNHNIINVGNTTEISFLSLSGAPSGYAAIYCYDIGDFAQAHKLSFTDCDTNVWIESVTQDTIFYGEYLDFNGEYSYGVKIIANNNFGATGNLENYYNFPTGASAQINNYLTGSGASINILSSSINGNNVSGTTAVYLQDGAYLDMSSVGVEDCYYGVRNGNVGLPCSFDINSTSFVNSGLYDISIENTNSVGSFMGSASNQKINNASSSVIWNFLDSDDGELNITRKLSVTFDDGTNTDLSTLLFESSTMGLLDGGVITVGTGLTINVSSGIGYLEKSSDIGIISKITWSGSVLNVSSNSELYIYVNENGILSSSGTKPNTVFNILLGRIITDASAVSIIDFSPLRSEHYGNSSDTFNRNALGSVFSTGSIVTENATPLRIDISQGVYYYGNNQFSPTGGTAVQFTQYSRNGMTGFTTTATTIINNTQYDNNGTLTGLTSSYYTKHTLYLVGDGVYEKYLLVLGQNEYATLVEAEGGLLPTPPSYFDDAISQIANIYVQQGFSGITQIEDIRPVIGFKAGGVNASSVHGNLLGLDADDHVQYLLVDGSRAMSGNLDIGNNAIISASTINGVTIQTHASRHLPNGADPLTTAAPVSVSNSNSEGIANSFARSDHQHAHGNLSGGTYHGVATPSVAGFMSSTDKTYLDSVPSLFNLKADLSGATFIGQISTPSVSATTMSATSLVLSSGFKLDGPTTAGYVLTTDSNGNGTWQLSSASGSTSGGGSSRLTGSTSTTTSGNTTLSQITGLTSDSTHFIEAYVTAKSSGTTAWGTWKRSIGVTTAGTTPTIRFTNADMDAFSQNLSATTVNFAISGVNININVSGVTNTAIQWNSAYEIITKSTKI
jgi:pectin methylesterase-like acyl-CoA thioesterase